MHLDEKSIFHTRELRNTKTNVHLLLVLICFISSLGVAIWFAEGSLSNKSTLRKITLKEDQIMADRHNQ